MYVMVNKLKWLDIKLWFINYNNLSPDPNKSMETFAFRVEQISSTPHSRFFLLSAEKGSPDMLIPVEHVIGAAELFIKQ